MADSMSISYKVYLEDSTDIAEVRRFGVDRSLAFKFSFLREKLQKVFPSLQSKNFDVYWKDQEGDSIIISSDEELTIALSEMNTDLRKLYVSIKPEENFVPDAEMNDMGRPVDGPAVHEGVTCDGCNKSITGFRYKCTVCPDFDLCSTCEGFGMHDEHFMIRISKPIKWRYTYSRRLAHQMAKWSRQSETHKHHHQRRASNVKSAGGQQANENSGNCPYRRLYSGHPGWLDYICSQLGDWVSPGDIESPTKAGDTAAVPENATMQGATAKPSTSGTAECAKTPGETVTPGIPNQPRDMTYLQNVGETVAALLNPLGIDVEIQVKDKNQKETAEKQKPSQVGTKAKGPEKTAEAKEAEKLAPPKGLEKMQAAVTEPMEVSAETPTAPPEQHSAEGEGWFLIPDDGSASPNPAASKRVDEMLAQFKEGSYREIYPTMNDVIARTRELELEQESITDPKVAATLKQLRAMGFTNEGGWLTQLITIKNGDIERVLDVLLPAKK